MIIHVGDDRLVPGLLFRYDKDVAMVICVGTSSYSDAVTFLYRGKVTMAFPRSNTWIDEIQVIE